MKPYEFDVDLDDIDDDGIAQAQTPGAAGNLVLNGALGTTLDYARILLFTSASDESGKTFTVTGTDADGRTITETVTGPNTTAVTTKLYKTITSIAVSAATTGTVKVGTRGTTLVAVTKAIALNPYSTTAAMVSVDVSGTISFSVEETFDDILTDGPATTADGNSVLWVAPTALSAKSADTNAQLTLGARGVRIKINSYSNGAELQAVVVQSHNTKG